MQEKRKKEAKKEEAQRKGLERRKDTFVTVRRFPHRPSSPYMRSEASERPEQRGKRAGRKEKERKEIRYGSSLKHRRGEGALLLQLKKNEYKGCYSKRRHHTQGREREREEEKTIPVSGNNGTSTSERRKREHGGGGGSTWQVCRVKAKNGRGMWDVY